MHDEKITVSMDEINRVTPVPGATHPPISNCGYEPPESGSKIKPKRTGLCVGIGIAIVALLCFIRIPQERTVADYKTEFVRDVNQELAKPDSSLKKRIEQAHLTVDVTSANIVRCDVTTVDGTERAGKDGSNISQVSILIRFHWNGIIDSGYTDLRVVMDVQNDRVLKSEIEHTTALVNTEDPELWWDVGFAIGTLLAL